MRALARQRDRLGQAIPPMLVRVVLFANNCADRSASLARKLEADLSPDVRVVTRTVYCRVGRLPRVPVGEDKALIALLSLHDARISHCPTAHVIASGRTDGRAPGGVADTVAIRSREPNSFLTTPWSHLARRSLAPHGEDVCDDGMARDASLSSKTRLSTAW